MWFNTVGLSNAVGESAGGIARGYYYIPCTDRSIGRSRIAHACAVGTIAHHACMQALAGESNQYNNRFSLATSIHTNLSARAKLLSRFRKKSQTKTTMSQSTTFTMAPSSNTRRTGHGRCWRVFYSYVVRRFSRNSPSVSPKAGATACHGSTSNHHAHWDPFVSAQ